MFKWLRRIQGQSSVAKSLLRYLWQERLWWMIPMAIVLLLVGALLLVASSTPLGAFIYTLV